MMQYGITIEQMPYNADKRTWLDRVLGETYTPRYRQDQYAVTELLHHAKYANIDNVIYRHCKIGRVRLTTEGLK